MNLEPGCTGLESRKAFISVENTTERALED